MVPVAQKPQPKLKVSENIMNIQHIKDRMKNPLLVGEILFHSIPNPYAPRDDEDAEDYDTYLFAISKLIQEYLDACWDCDKETFTLAETKMTIAELLDHFKAFCFDQAIMPYLG